MTYQQFFFGYSLGSGTNVLFEGVLDLKDGVRKIDLNS